MRSICILTGSRAEYGLLRPVAEEIRAQPGLKLLLLVTGMHLAAEFGRTLTEVKRDGFKVSGLVRMNPPRDELCSMARAIGKGVIGITRFLEEKRPDILIVLGDRTEALAGAIAAAYMNI